MLVLLLVLAALPVAQTLQSLGLLLTGGPAALLPLMLRAGGLPGCLLAGEAACAAPSAVSLLLLLLPAQMAPAMLPHV